MNKKVKTLNEIVKIVGSLKKQGKKIVTYNGSFDILHIGHIKSLQEAKKQGEVLLVLLNSDASVRIYKGPGHPVNSQNDRAQFLAALEIVDYVTIFTQINPKKVLDKIKPDIHCNGSDWGRHCIEREVVEKNGGKIHVLKWLPGFSTSGLIKKTGKDIKAVFLDRDGTINVYNPGYIYKIEDFKFAPGAIFALQKLSKSDYKIIIVTNQSGIGRGYYKEKDVKILHTWMLSQLRKEGVRIDKIYYCPHGPSDNCACRKPNIGMFLEAAQDFGVNLSKSWMIGDDERDIMMGREANVKTIKIGEKMPATLKLEPNYYAKNLSKAVNIILKNE